MENKHEYCSHFFISIFSLKPGNPNVVDTFSNDVCILNEYKLKEEFKNNKVKVENFDSALACLQNAFENNSKKLISLVEEGLQKRKLKKEEVHSIEIYMYCTMPDQKIYFQKVEFDFTLNHDATFSSGRIYDCYIEDFGLVNLTFLLRDDEEYEVASYEDNNAPIKQFPFAPNYENVTLTFNKFDDIYKLFNLVFKGGENDGETFVEFMQEEFKYGDCKKKDVKQIELRLFSRCSPDGDEFRQIILIDIDKKTFTTKLETL